jgi:NADH-quinone oxidoreductase subunit J
MTMNDWLSQPENYVFLVLALPMVFGAWRVVTTRNVVHAALYLVLTLAGSAALFLLMGAEFVAWTVVLVYIGAVVVLFLFGVMITRAPLGRQDDLSHAANVRVPAAAISFALFIIIGGSMLSYFGGEEFTNDAGVTRTGDIGLAIFERFVIPFEVVSLVLLAALIGGIVLARKDPTPEDAEAAAALAEASSEGGDA